MHSEICISAHVNDEWALSLSTRYCLLIVVQPAFWLLRRLGSFEVLKKIPCGIVGCWHLICVSGRRLPYFGPHLLISHTSESSFPVSSTALSQTWHLVSEGLKSATALLGDLGQITSFLYSTVTPSVLTVRQACC